MGTAWATPGNWNPAGVPVFTDDVVIPNTANQPIVNGPRQVNNLTLNSGATLTTANGSLLTLNGNFVNNGGTVLGAGDGEVRFAGPALQTISGTATQFQNLTVGLSGVTLNAPVSVLQLLSINEGTLTTNGNLTLLSNAAGTADVINNGTGATIGMATVQRYIDPTRNTGLGYRHYSAPVSGSTVADLTTPGFTPLVNLAYNTQGSTVSPFPTVFGYDESRVNTSGNPSPQDFDKGWFSPNTLADPLTVTRGYTVNIASSETVDFTGTLNTGNYSTGSLGLGNQTQSGFHLRGNPYPSPIDWELVVRNNVDPTVYVYRSSGQYAGTYSTYTVNAGTGTNGGERNIPVAQGFFVRAFTTNASLTFSNTARRSTYVNPVFQRGATTAPLVRLDLRNAAGSADEAIVYFEANATRGFDSEFDAFKLLGGSPLALASAVGTNTLLAVNGLPALTTVDVTVPLRVQATAGTNTLRATELLRLPAGTHAYLQDALTGAAFDLSQPAGYDFTVTTAAVLMGRFSLLVTQQLVLSTATAALARQVALYPNPAKSATFVELPVALGRTAVTASLVDALGRIVRTQALPAQGAAAHQLSLAGVANGIYTLQLNTSAGLLVKKLVVE